MTAFASTATSSGLTTATTAYTAKDVLGSVLTFTGVGSANGGLFRIESLIAADKANILGPFELHLFNASPTSQGADNAAYAINDTEVLTEIGMVSGYFVGTGSANRSAYGAMGLPIVGKCGGSTTSIYGVLVTLSGHTFFGAAGDIQVTLAGVQDP